MKVLFSTYEGAPYHFDPVTRQISPASGTDCQREKWTGGQIFERMAIPTLDEVAYRVNHEQQILLLNVTEDCSNRCSYCVYSGHYTFERTHAKRSMNAETAKEAVRHFIEHSHTGKSAHISFYGGEPLMDSAFELVQDVVSSTKASTTDSGNIRRITFGLTTNGRHFSEDRIRFLVSNEIGIRVSLDGPSQIHDRYRRSSHGEPTFSEIVAGLERLNSFSSDYYRTVTFICVLTPPLDFRAVRDFFNYEPLVKNHNLLVSFVSMFDHRLPFVTNERQFASDTSEMYRESIAGFYRCAISNTLDTCSFESGLLLKVLSLLHVAQRDKGELILGPNGQCIPGTIRCFVNTDGTLHACEKTGLSHPIGDTHTWVDANKSLALLREYRDLSLQECLECWCGNICDLCITSCTRGVDLDLTKKRMACLERRDYFRASLRLYASLKDKLSEERLREIIPEPDDED